MANQFFEHSAEESHFFILLVCRDRSGTKSLYQYYDQQIQALVKKNMNVVERLGRKEEINPEARGIYYSSWIYSAVHMMCLIPGQNTKKTISEKLHVSINVIGKVLDFLEEQKLINKSAQGYTPTNSWVRLDQSSPHIVNLHTNWRQKAIQNLDTQDESDLHFSGLYTLDLLTARKIKDRFLEVLKEEVKKVEPAPSEILYVLGMDWFQLK